MMKPIVKFATRDPQQFFATLRKRVNTYFEENELAMTSNTQMILKTICMFGLYFIPYALILTGWFPFWMILILCFIMGLGKSGIGFSVMHDANHGAYTRNKTVGTLLGYTMNLIGGSKFTWMVQHNVLHHTYTNIYELDEDVDDKPILRLSPYGKLKSIHRYQHFYAIFLYMLMTLSWVVGKDFKQLRNYNKEGVTQQLGYNPTTQLLILVISKVLYILYMLVIPILVLNIAWWQWLIGFLLIHAVAGVLTATVFQLAHVVEGPTHHKPTEQGSMENTWAIHQLETTANFSRNSRLFAWFIGGLNFQIEHHLFPKICHIHYKAISDIVKKTALEHGLPYHDQRNYLTALGSHFRVLKRLGRNEALA